MAAGAALANGSSSSASVSSSWTIKGRGTPGKYITLHDLKGYLGTPGDAGSRFNPTPVQADASGNWQVTFTPGSLPSVSGAQFIDFVAVERDTASGAGTVSSAVSRIYLDSAAPTLLSTTAGFDPEGAPGVENITLRFSEPVRWLDAADFQLSDGTGGPPVSLAGISLESSDNTNWTFTGLSSLLAANRTYTLTHTNPSKVTDEAGRPVSGGIPAFRFFVYNGGASNDSAWLAATASAIVIYANGSPTPSYTLPAGSVDQILVSGAAGNDTLVDQIPAFMRPARGVAFHGGAGASDYANIQGSSANDTIDAHLGSVTVQPAGSPAGLTEYDAETVEILAIAANAGIDTIRVHDLTLSAYLDGGDGDDVIDLDYSASGLSPSVAGGAGNDTIHGSPGNDYIAGNTGDDTIYGYAGADQVYGDDPSGSAVTGSPGVDNLYGGEGNDTLYGDGCGYGVTGNSDYLYGDDGDDTLHGDDGDGGSGATATGTRLLRVGRLRPPGRRRRERRAVRRRRGRQLRLPLLGARLRHRFRVRLRRHRLARLPELQPGCVDQPGQRRHDTNRRVRPFTAAGVRDAHRKRPGHGPGRRDHR